jgi:hypothetical protein
VHCIAKTVAVFVILFLGYSQTICFYYGAKEGSPQPSPRGWFSEDQRSSTTDSRSWEASEDIVQEVGKEGESEEEQKKVISQLLGLYCLMPQRNK